jgi:hypothetical protein
MCRRTVYPTIVTYQGGASLNGNDTYTITFTPAGSDPSLPVAGTYPPLVDNASGQPEGFWSLTVYQPDPSEAAAPFLSQASVLNTSYSTADNPVISVSSASNTITVAAPTWGAIAKSAPVLFGANAAEYGLEPGTVYYVAGDPVASTDAATGATTYSFQVSSQWIQNLSPNNVPIQDSGKPGPIVALDPQAGAGALSYGIVQPVSQLGSAQLTAGQLVENPNGSITIWIGPSLPAGAPASNWIPTPSTP